MDPKLARTILESLTPGRRERLAIDDAALAGLRALVLSKRGPERAAAAGTLVALAHVLETRKRSPAAATRLVALALELLPSLRIASGDAGEARAFERFSGRPRVAAPPSAPIAPRVSAGQLLARAPVRMR